MIRMFCQAVRSPFQSRRASLVKAWGLYGWDDLLTDRGRILGVANQDLIAAFLPTTPLPEHVGLGAVQFMDDGEIVFSVQNAFCSKKLGVTLHPGDLLSNIGTMVK